MQASYQKNSVHKVVQLYRVITGILSEDLNMHSFGHKTQSFRHNLNIAYNQKILLQELFTFKVQLKK